VLDAIVHHLDYAGDPPLTVAARPACVGRRFSKTISYWLKPFLGRRAARFVIGHDPYSHTLLCRMCCSAAANK
jgi:hypothetical protein